jgi:putative transposase
VPFYPERPRKPTFADLLRSFAVEEDLFTPQEVQALCDRHGLRFGDGPDDVWNPVLTLWAFLWQAVSTSKSCAAAVARALVWRLALGLAPCSANPGAYCKARQKLPEAFLERFALDLGARIEERAPQSWLWRGRRVKVVDGCTVTAPDTPANQAEYPQRDGIPKGAGFPLVRLVVLFGLATGACTDARTGPYSGKGSGETTLARSLLESLAPGEVLLGDRIFATYWILAWLLARQCDGVFRLHAHRTREGGTRASRLERRLGNSDNLLVWRKPRRPEWMDEETFAAMPAELRVRVLWRRIEVPGFRTQEVTLVTTLTDEAACPAEELFGLYRRRWQAELDLRSLKQTMKMEHLSCLSPSMLRKELWAHLIGYNLTRAAQAKAAQQKGVEPWRLSFAGARDLVSEMREHLTWSAQAHRAVVLAALWLAVGQRAVQDRPNRVEPRRVKRGPKAYLRLREPRAQARQRAIEQAAQTSHSG